MIDYIVYGAIVYLVIGGCMYQTIFHQQKLDGRPLSRYLWATLPFWFLVFLIGRNKR